MGKELIYIIIAILAVVIAIVITYIFASRKELAIDSTLGKKCVVTVEVNNFAGRGQVRIGKETFACRTLFDEDIYEIGEKVLVVAIEGAKLVCKRL